MKIDLRKCDAPSCGKEFRPTGGAQVQFSVGLSPDPAGGHSETDDKYADLCNECLAKCALHILSRCAITHPVQAEIAKKFGAR